MHSRRTPGPSVLAILALAFASVSAHAQEPGPAVAKLTLVETHKIWDGAGHNAFTDLLRYKDAWICVFRESSAHVPGTNGVIRVLRSKDTKTWESIAAVAEKGIDLRDPKVSVAPDGRLMLLAGGSIYDGEDGQPKRKRTGARTRVFFSMDGATWTAPAVVDLPEGEWLWRVTWREGTAYGVSYSTDAVRKFVATLWKSTDGVHYEKVVPLDPPCAANETTLRFEPDGTMLALVRGEQADRHNALGRSAPPYSSWSWTDTGHPAHGPDFIRRADGAWIYAGREYEGGAKTVVGELRDGKCLPLVTLPSGGDCSYPGLAWDGDELLVSYYASHEGKTSIYFARLK